MSTRLIRGCLVLVFLLGQPWPGAPVRAGAFASLQDGINTSSAPSGENPSFQPAVVRAITIHPEDPLRLDFVLDRGDDLLTGADLQSAGMRMIKYFLTALTVPDDELWVNLSPYEPGRIVPDGLGQTEMGLDMLAQDYLLKQTAASFSHPGEELGAAFWQRVYQRMADQPAALDLSIDAFHKIWIVPQNAVIYERGNTAFVANSHLTVMMEDDYWARTAAPSDGPAAAASDVPDTLGTLSSQAVRETILPALEREVNDGERFATVRQIYNSMILAVWYKRRLREGLLGQVYADQNKMRGVDSAEPLDRERIYHQYIEALAKGAVNLVHEDYDPQTRRLIPRKYFSGGLTAPQVRHYPIATLADDPARLGARNEVPRADDLAARFVTLETSLWEIGGQGDVDQALSSPVGRAAETVKAAIVNDRARREDFLAILGWLAEREVLPDDYNLVFLLGSKSYNPVQQAVDLWQERRTKILVAGGIGWQSATLRQLVDENGLSKKAEDEINRILDGLSATRQAAGEQAFWAEVADRFHIKVGLDQEKINLRAQGQLHASRLDWLRFYRPHLTAEDIQRIESGEIPIEEFVFDRLLDPATRYDILIPEGMVYAAILMSEGVDPDDIYVDAQSTSHPENITYGAEVLLKENFAAKNIVLIQEAFMQKRAKATFLKQFPAAYSEDWGKDSHVYSLAASRYDESDLAQMTAPAVLDLLNNALAEVRKFPEYYANGSLARVDIPADIQGAYDRLQTAWQEFQMSSPVDLDRRSLAARYEGIRDAASAVETINTGPSPKDLADGGRGHLASVISRSFTEDPRNAGTLKNIRDLQDRIRQGLIKRGIRNVDDMFSWKDEDYLHMTWVALMRAFKSELDPGVIEHQGEFMDILRRMDRPISISLEEVLVDQGGYILLTGYVDDPQELRDITDFKTQIEQQGRAAGLDPFVVNIFHVVLGHVKENVRVSPEDFKAIKAEITRQNDDLRDAGRLYTRGGRLIDFQGRNRDGDLVALHDTERLIPWVNVHINDGKDFIRQTNVRFVDLLRTLYDQTASRGDILRYNMAEAEMRDRGPFRILYHPDAMTPARTDNRDGPVIRPFNPDLFNFNHPVTARQRLFETEIAGVPVRIQVDIGPQFLYHFLFLIAPEEDIPLLIDEDHIRLSLALLDLSGAEYLKLGNNSFRAGGEVNHLHIHGIFYDRPLLPIEETEQALIARVGDVAISELAGPYKGFVFSGGNGEVARLSAALIRKLQADNIAYNVIMTKQGVFVLPRAHEAVAYPGMEGVYNLNYRDMAGVFAVPNQELLDGITPEALAEFIRYAAIQDPEFDQIKEWLRQTLVSSPMDEVAGSGNDLIKEIGEMKSQNNVKVVGIAGLSGAGKTSLVSAYLKDHGYPVIAGDGFHHHVGHVADAGLKERLRLSFGDQVFAADGSANWEFIFSINKLSQYRDMVAPYVRVYLLQQIKAALAATNQPVVFIDYADFGRIDFDKTVLDQLWFVDRTQELRGDGLRQRAVGQGRSVQFAEEGMQNLAPLWDEQVALRDEADLIIDNNGTKDETRQQVADALAQLRTIGAHPFALSSPGGIDFNPEYLDLQIKRDANGVPLPLGEQPIYEMQIQGILPVIIQIAPVDPQLILGAVDGAVL